jgi:hypothetical protein
MIAVVLDTLIALGLFALAVLFCMGAWVALGRPEHICPGCDMPDSRCACEDWE